jgi:O-antigen ligase
LLVVYRGANTDGAIFAAGILAIFVFATSVFVAASRIRPKTTIASKLLLVAFALIGASAAAMLLPISNETFLSFAGRSHYAEILAYQSALSDGPRSLALSLDPTRSMIALVVLVVAAAIALSVALLSRRALLAVLGAYAVIVVLEAVIGLLQLGLGSPSFLSYDAAVGGRRAAGTFVNKNHFATFLAMALPLLLMRSAGHFSFFLVRDRNSALRRAWWGFATALVAAALVASVSRAGAAAGFTVALIAVVVCLVSTTDLRQRLAFAAIAIVAIAIAAMAGFQLMLESVSGNLLDQSVGSRNLLNAMTLDGVKAFFPIGAGLGSYAIAFPRFQRAEFPGFVEHAHNDYLQLLFELGFVGAIVLLLLGASWLLNVYRRFAERSTVPLTNPAVACALGVLAFAIHAWFDFPARIPSVAWAATLLLAASFHPELVASRASRHDRRRRRPSDDEQYD